MNIKKPPLYLQLKETLHKRIVEGIYSNGETLPTEAALCKEFDLSRVTVRKALDELKGIGAVSAVQGQGTVVTSRKKAFAGSMEMIALIAPVHDWFLNLFYQHFESAAEKAGSLILLKLDRSGKQISNPALFNQLSAKGIRDFVLWPHQGFSNLSLLERLRSLGMNLVFFDHVIDSPFVDSVSVDNRHGIGSLAKALQTRVRGRIDFIGWDNVLLASTEQREEAFNQINNRGGLIHHISLADNFSEKLLRKLNSLKKSNNLPEAFICSNGDIAAALDKVLNGLNIKNIVIGSIDRCDSSTDRTIVSYEQPMKKLADQVFDCLQNQNKKSASWKASSYLIKGKTV
ncbi:MAG: GntR family transcriptional regulator [Planctomycetota bacterium]|jgi:DNA-binding LacI/PurR family transcriptional regulator